MRLVSPFIALALFTSSALAADVSPLSPGTPAGVKKAAMEGNTLLYVGLGAAAIAVIAIVASDGDDAKVTPAPPTTTTSTGTA
jgi:N-acetylneuraminic acid mutarotase